MTHTVSAMIAAIVVLLFGHAPRVTAQLPSRVPADTARADTARADTARADSTRCFDCLRSPHFGRAVLASGIGLALPYSINRFVKREGISSVSPRTWRANLRGRWEWDPNGFAINQFGHPIQGSMYYNGFRANGYGFWPSAAAATTGAFLWECCFETNRIAINDLITTSLGGMSVGEYSWRLSDLILDSRSTGVQRVLREAAAGVVNPVRLVHRVVRREAWRRGPNPTGPETLASRFSVGALRVGQNLGGASTTMSGAALTGVLQYGDPLEDLTRTPFSYFDLRGTITTIPKATFYEVQAQAGLGGRVLSRRDGIARRSVGALLQYEYDDNPAFEYGAQKVALAYRTRWSPRPQTTLVADATARGIILGAVGADERGLGRVGRNYDFGSGGGAAADVAWVAHDRGELRLSGAVLGIATLDGGARSHVLRRGSASATLQLSRHFGVTGTWRNNYRRSVYGRDAAITALAPEWRLSLSALTQRSSGRESR